MDFLFIALSAACFANASLYVFLTEVMKRYLLDCWTAFAIIIICGAVEMASWTKEMEWKLAKPRLFAPILTVVILFGVYMSYSANDIGELKGLSVSYNGQDGIVSVLIPNYDGEVFYSVNNDPLVPFSDDGAAAITVPEEGILGFFTITIPNKHEIRLNGYPLG